MTSATPAENRKAISGTIMRVVPLLLGLDALGTSDLSEDVREPATDAIFDALAAIGADRARGWGPFSNPAVRFEVPFLATLKQERLAREMLGKTAGRLGVDDVAEDLRRVKAQNVQILSLLSAKTGPSGPLFSVAAEAFIEGRIKTYGARHHPEIGYLRHRTAVFLAIIGDKPIDAYDRSDLQTFANELSWLPPNISKQDGYDVARFAEYIAANKEAQGPGLAEKSIRETYLSRIKTILRESCADAKVSIGFEGRIVIPKRAAPSKRRMAPDQGEFGKVIAAGVASGFLSDALLPALGQLAGRRLGLLAFMRRENILFYNGVWVYRPQSHILRDGRWEPIPFKTDESLGIFVLHEIFEKCGFIAWALREPGAVFSMLMRAQDPADAAQKRMKRLYKSSGADPRRSGTFHGLRAGKIRNDRDLELPARALRLQVGHELTDVHECYDGQMTDRELMAFATAPLPKGVDWSLLNTIDFEAFAARQPKGGRPAKKLASGLSNRSLDGADIHDRPRPGRGTRHYFGACSVEAHSTSPAARDPGARQHVADSE